MASLIASSVNAATSADFDVTAGVPVTLLLYGADGQMPGNGMSAQVLAKTSGSTYTPVGELNSTRPALVIAGPGTFKVVKTSSAVACGVDKT